MNSTCTVYMILLGRSTFARFREIGMTLLPGNSTWLEQMRFPNISLIFFAGFIAIYVSWLKCESFSSLPSCIMPMLSRVIVLAESSGPPMAIGSRLDRDPSSDRFVGDNFVVALFPPASETSAFASRSKWRNFIPTSAFSALFARRGSLPPCPTALTPELTRVASFSRKRPLLVTNPSLSITIGPYSLRNASSARSPGLRRHLLSSSAFPLSVGIRNKQIIFAKRPVNKLGLDSFRTDVVEPFDWKSVELKKGDILVRNLLISIDPSMRFHMEHHPGGFTYIPILETEEPVHARAISVVLRSEREDIKEGEIRWVSSDPFHQAFGS